jgi:ligand-binding sensor domain-containing protein
LKASVLTAFFILIAVFLICLPGAMKLSAQESNIRFDQITTENTIRVKGLSQNSAFSLLMDSHGFMWIGTWDGLNKYDGYNFIYYTKENGLSNTTINYLLEDDEHNLWIATDYGLNKLERETGIITRFLHDESNPNSIGNNFITHLFQDKDGYIWICTADGLNRYDKNLRIFTTYNFFSRDADSAITNYISSSIQDSRGLIWIGTRYGLHTFNPVTNNFGSYDLGKDDGTVAAFNRYFINDVVEDHDGHICIGTRNGVYILDPDQGIVQNLNQASGEDWRLSGNLINALLVDKKGQLWVGSTEGLDLFDPLKKRVMSYKSGPSTLDISNNDIKCLYQDPTGAIWIGTYKGLNKVDQSPSRFTHYSNEQGEANSLSDNIVYAILEDKQGLLWIGTYGGVNIYDRKKEQFSVIMHDPKDNSSICSNKIRALVLDSAGYVWIGTETSGIDRYDPKTGMVLHFEHKPEDTNSLTANNILSMMCDSHGKIWIGTDRGLNILDPVTGMFSRIAEGAERKPNLVNNLVWTLYEDRHGYFWVGTGEGLMRFSPDLQTAMVLTNKPSEPNSLSTNRVFSVYGDKDDIYWFGTAGGGLDRYDPETGEFRIYTEKNGLPNNIVYATLEDDEGNLWITTNWGISKFNKQSEVFVNYDTRDGVQGNEFNAGAYFKNSLGEMFFGGMSGFNVFHPKGILLNRIPPRIIVTSLKVFNEPIRRDLEDGEVIRLNYTENFFAFEFAALDFNNPSKNLYRYKLENYDDSWIYTNAAQRRAEYRKVSPGTYRFMVTGSNNDGVWNPNGISLTITISPPWWKSWMFRIAFIVVTFLLAWSLIYLRISNIRKKHDVEKKMLSIEKQIFELEQKALRLQMNPHFIFNSLNAIQNFVLSNDTDRAVNYLAKFSHLMRMILANSTASHIPLKDEMKALAYYMDLEKLRFDNKFSYEVNIDPAIDEEFIEIPPMIIQPYVENAIIHGLVNSPKKGLLQIWLKLEERGILHCIIQDNGIGREKAIEIRSKSGIKRQPKGMIITQERLQILSRQNRKDSVVKVTDLTNEKGEPAGTRIELEIHYKEI